MSSRGLPKKGKRRPEEAAGSSTSGLQTADDYYEKASENEESGDRWLSSDLSKALRFYQKAFALYLQAIELDPAHTDAKYNASRLLFSVYTDYIKNEGVNLSDLSNCEEALNRSDFSVVKPIEQVAQFYSQCLDSPNWDLSFNAALCFFEYAEKTASKDFGTALQAADRAKQLLEKTLDDQIAAVQNEDDEVTQDEVLETCIECYRLAAAVNEAVYTEEMSNSADQILLDLITRADQVVSELVDVDEEDLNEARMAKLEYLASRGTDFASMQQAWQSDLEESGEKLMLEAGSYRTLLGKLADANAAISDDDKWEVLTQMDRLYRQALTLLKEDLEDSEEEDQKSSILAQIAAVFIEQADIALERSQLSSETALKYRATLQKNSRSLLKNAMTFAKKSAGLRESALGKLLRTKRLREAVARLSVLEQKPPPLNVEQELIDLQEIDAYKSN